MVPKPAERLSEALSRCDVADLCRVETLADVPETARATVAAHAAYRGQGPSCEGKSKDEVAADLCRRYAADHGAPVVSGSKKKGK